MRAGAGTQPQMSSSSGDDREARLQERALGIRPLGWEAGCSGLERGMAHTPVLWASSLPPAPAHHQV